MSSRLIAITVTVRSAGREIGKQYQTVEMLTVMTTMCGGGVSIGCRDESEYCEMIGALTMCGGGVLIGCRDESEYCEMISALMMCRYARYHARCCWSCSRHQLPQLPRQHQQPSL